MTRFSWNQAVVLCCGLLAWTGCDCDDCDYYKSSIENYKELLQDDSFGDLSWEETCTSGTVENDLELYYCENMWQMCDYQQKYNECVEEKCYNEDKIEVECDPFP